MTFNEAIKHPDFQGLPSNEKIKVLSTLEPDFAGLPQAEQMKVLNMYGDNKPSAENNTYQMPKTGNVIQPVPLAGQYPNLYGAYGALIKPTIELGAMGMGGAVGGLAGAPAGPVGAGAGALGGAGLGYAAGANVTENIESALEGSSPQRTLKEQALKTGEDIKTGAAYEAGGQVAGKAISAVTPAAVSVGKWLGQKAKNWYSKAASIPASKDELAVALNRFSRETKTEITEQDVANIWNDIKKGVSEGLEKKIMPSEKGASETLNLLKTTHGEIDTAIAEATTQGKQIKVKDVLSALTKKGGALEKARNMAGTEAERTKAIDYVKDIYSRYYKEGEFITPERAQVIKRSMDKIVDFGEEGTRFVKDDAIKSMRYALKSALEDAVPALKGLNEDSQAYQSLFNGIVNTLSKEDKAKFITAGDAMIATGGAAITGGSKLASEAAGILSKVSRIPKIKAKIAFALNAASKTVDKAATENIIPDIFKRAGSVIADKQAKGLALTPLEAEVVNMFENKPELKALLEKSPDWEFGKPKTIRRPYQLTEAEIAKYRSADGRKYYKGSVTDAAETFPLPPDLSTLGDIHGETAVFKIAGKEYPVNKMEGETVLEAKKRIAQELQERKNISALYKKDTSKNRSISEVIQDFGISPNEYLKGEAKRLNEFRKPYTKKFIKKEGYSFDELTTILHELGYYSERPDIDTILNDIEKDAFAKMQNKTSGRIYSQKHIESDLDIARQAYESDIKAGRAKEIDPLTREENRVLLKLLDSIKRAEKKGKR